ncbi:flavin reductase family protein [Desulfopila inferna]|uniref:flavin reductase family protein n=1 Tax=Desulfopila inferna TaxID=468528 RepID=UPI001964E4B9|nr:flavin reductase family protein [Desulfopila inferna]MBM9604712.1 flavin reductase family protein [Desulfopila inferna]
MEKTPIDSNAFVYPMPMVLVGAMVAGKANFMAVAWVTRVCMKPPLLVVALGGRHHTNKGIEENDVFSVNIPSTALITKTDYCGLVSGGKTDKSQMFDIFYGELEKAPLISECPVCIACKVYEKVQLPADTLYIGEIIDAYSEERYLTDGKPDIRKIDPFTLSMPDNNYWKVGENVGKAWSVGKNLKG